MRSLAFWDLKWLNGLVILMYHSIADNPCDPHAIHPGEFARQMSQLAKDGYHVVDLMDGISELHKWKNNSRTVALTFDDAYQDFLLNAAPILNQRGFPATVFAPTGLLGGTATWDTYDKTKQLMDWDGLREAQRLGFGIASHTLSHPRLTECSAAELEHELLGSLDALRDHLPVLVPVLSYPAGYFGRREMNAARKAGYVAAVGVASHWANYPWTNPYNLHRRRGDS